MTKKEITKEVSDKTGIEGKKAEIIIEAFMNSVKEHLLRQEKVSFRRFGNFMVKKRASKIAQNISKGTSINVPAYYIPVFKPSTEFKKAVKKTVQ